MRDRGVLRARRAVEAAALAAGSAELLACLLLGPGGCRAVSAAGGEAAYMAIGVAVYLLADGALGVRLVSGLALGAALDVFLKVLIKLPRPPASTWLAHATGPGFPSGHVLLATLFWGIVTVETGSPLVAAGGAASTAAVSWSRLALHVHYPRDVAGGIVLGLALALLYWGIRGSMNTLRASAAMTAPAMALAWAAAAMSPGYVDALHAAGITAGLLAGIALLSTPQGKRSLVERLGPRGLGVAAAVSLAGAAAAALTAHEPPPLPMLGFALFAFLVATSRPLGMAA